MNDILSSQHLSVLSAINESTKQPAVDFLRIVGKTLPPDSPSAQAIPLLDSIIEREEL